MGHRIKEQKKNRGILKRLSKLPKIFETPVATKQGVLTETEKKMSKPKEGRKE